MDKTDNVAYIAGVFFRGAGEDDCVPVTGASVKCDSFFTRPINLFSIILKQWIVFFAHSDWLLNQ